MPYIIAVDTGGTFSDCVIVGEDGTLLWGKAPSTPEDFSLGVMKSVESACENAGLSWEEVLKNTSTFLHGTTVSTNAFLTRRGAKVGLLTTRGHEDAIIIGRVHQKVAGLVEEELINVARLRKAVPIVPRPLIKGITERLDWQGRVVVALNEEEVRQATRELVEQSVESIAICFLWSFANPSHERRARDLVQQLYPDLFVTISSELAPVIKEYERVATTALNAYLSPVTSRYLSRLSRRLEEQGYQRGLGIMSCSGGIISAEEAGLKSVFTLSSGPVGGAIGTAVLGAKLGMPNIITSDVGGTSFDVGLIVNNQPQFATAPVVGQYHVLTPMVDIVSIGAGAGSIAWIEPKTGALKVGPQSAGAEPGPVCYKLGGTEPTVADADLVLGRLDADYFLGGKMKLDKEKSVMAFQEKIARPLKMEAHEAAMAVLDIVDSHMADLVRKVTVGRGYDPRNFVLLSFGGAGPTHVGAYARDVGVKTAMVPRTAAVFSAFGIASADMVYVREISEPMIMPGEAARMEQHFTRQEREIKEKLQQDGFQEEEIVLSRYLEMRYRRQVHGLYCPVPAKVLKPQDIEGLIQVFHDLYEQKYGAGTAYKEAGVEAATFRVTGIGKRFKHALAEQSGDGAEPSAVQKGERKVCFRESGGFLDCPVYSYEKLRPGNILPGPTIIERADTTVVVHPQQEAEVDQYLNLYLKMGDKR
jgi:N-methylhydantoinase A